MPKELYLHQCRQNELPVTLLALDTKRDLWLPQTQHHLCYQAVHVDTNKAATSTISFGSDGMSLCEEMLCVRSNTLRYELESFYPYSEAREPSCPQAFDFLLLPLSAFRFLEEYKPSEHQALSFEEGFGAYIKDHMNLSASAYIDRRVCDMQLGLRSPSLALEKRAHAVTYLVQPDPIAIAFLIYDIATMTDDLKNPAAKPLFPIFSNTSFQKEHLTKSGKQILLQHIIQETLHDGEHLPAPSPSCDQKDLDAFVRCLQNQKERTTRSILQIIRREATLPDASLAGK